jgi:hypothetical protein
MIPAVAGTAGLPGNTAPWVKTPLLRHRWPPYHGHHQRVVPHGVNIGIDNNGDQVLFVKVSGILAVVSSPLPEPVALKHCSNNHANTTIKTYTVSK